MRYPILFLLFLITFPGFSQNRQGKDFALFFAVEAYQVWPRLRSPIDDAEAIAKDLKNLYGFTTEVIKNPNRNQIYDKLDEYTRKAYAPDAQLLIFFSGHGDFIAGKGEGFFIPVDGKLKDPYQDSYLPHTRLRNIVDNIPVQHILLSIDACYSGTFDESIIYKDRSFGRPGDTEARKRQTFIDNSLQYRSRFFLSSGGKERTPDPSQFAAQFKAGLRSFGGADEILELPELFFQYLNKATPTPRMGQFGRNEPGSNFLFVLQSKVSKPSTIPNQEESTWQIARQHHTIQAYQAYLALFPRGRYRAEAEAIIKGLSPLDNMVFVQGGTFQMGSKDGDNDETPHSVTLSDFYIGRYEVTFEEYDAFCVATGKKKLMTEAGDERGDRLFG